MEVDGLQFLATYVEHLGRLVQNLMVCSKNNFTETQYFGHISVYSNQVKLVFSWVIGRVYDSMSKMAWENC